MSQKETGELTSRHTDLQEEKEGRSLVGGRGGPTGNEPVVSSALQNSPQPASPLDIDLKGIRCFSLPVGKGGSP